MLNLLKCRVEEQQDNPGFNLQNFDHFYNDHFPKIYNYVRFRVSNHADADDLTSVIFERAITNIRQFNTQKGNFATWLFAIANNAVIDYFKSNAKNPKIPFDLLSITVSGAQSPEYKVIERELRKNLLLALQELDAEKRNIVALKFWGELNNRQIAEITGLTESNVGVTLYRTLRQLKTILEKKGVAIHE